MVSGCGWGGVVLAMSCVRNAWACGGVVPFVGWAEDFWRALEPMGLKGGQNDGRFGDVKNLVESVLTKQQ